MQALPGAAPLGPRTVWPVGWAEPLSTETHQSQQLCMARAVISPISQRSRQRKGMELRAAVAELPRR